MGSASVVIETDTPYGLCSGRRMTEKPHLSSAEAAACDAIKAKDRDLRAFLSSNELAEPIEPGGWLQYLTNLKHNLGNLNNNVGFVATLLVKAYLERRFAITDFDAGAKAQGAAGIDIVAKTGDGKMIVGELKTTKPYQPGFGAQQRTTILKDLNRLARTTADHRLMFVIDADTFQTLCGKNFSSRAPGIEVVDLVYRADVPVPKIRLLTGSGIGSRCG